MDKNGDGFIGKDEFKKFLITTTSLPLDNQEYNRYVLYSNTDKIIRFF